MDARLSAEQAELRDAAARLADDLGPHSVLDLDDADRVARLEKALASAGWRTLRSDGASGVEIALVAEELARGLVDVPFLGRVLADALRPSAGRPSSQPTTLAAATRITPATGLTAIDARGATRALTLNGTRLLAAPVGEPVPGVDLTRATAPLTGPLEPAGEISAAHAARWQALAIVVTTAEMVGAARGAHALAVEYSKVRAQYGQAIGSYQAIAHLLAEGLALIEGCESILRYAAWAVDEMRPAEANKAARIAKVYCQDAARTVCETAIQVHGGIGNTWECLAHVYLRRVLVSAETFQSGWRRSTLDYRDSEQEARFRARLREWLSRNARRYPLTGDEYWARYGEWHRALYDAGFFGLSWPREYGGHELPAVYDVILDEELAAAGAPPRPSLGYLVTGLGHHASPELCRRFLPGMINGTERWCQGFSEPGAGSDLAALTTTAVRDGDDYVISGHKIWTSYSDVADWCLLLARTDPDAPRHKGISAFVISMHQPGIEQRPLTMISGVSTEFGQVRFDGARVPAADMAGVAGAGWKLAMTVVAHEREPSTLGFTARYGKTVKKLAASVAQSGAPAPAELRWAHVQTQMLYAHVRRRLSEQLDGLTHSSDGSLDKLLMTWTEQAVGHAALAVAGTGDAEALEAYMYSRAQSVMGGTSQIQKNIIAGRILGLSV